MQSASWYGAFGHRREKSMKTITLRNLPPDLRRRIEEEAAATGASYAKTVIRLLRAATGLTGSRSSVRHDDLDELAGTWSPQEGDEFERILAQQRRIDPELWD
jgi:plasmid stability protein